MGWAVLDVDDVDENGEMEWRMYSKMDEGDLVLIIE